MHKDTEAEQLLNCLTGSSLRFVCLLSMFTGCEEFLTSFKFVSSVSKKLQHDVFSRQRSFTVYQQRLLCLFHLFIVNVYYCF